MDKKETVNTKSNSRNSAYELCLKEDSHGELLELISGGTDAEKQISILKLKSLESQKDAEILVSRLTGQDGKIREAAAFKINEFINQAEYKGFFNTENFLDKLLDALCDINPNVTRLTLDSLTSIEAKDYFSKNLIERILETISSLNAEKQTVRQKTKKSHKINKLSFQLYWLLEGMSMFLDCLEKKDIERILLQTHENEDYPIREKTAKIIACLDFQTDSLKMIKQKILTDENYYVRNFLCKDL